jgi:hypothetical protein
MGLEGPASHQSALSVNAPIAVGVYAAFRAAAKYQNSAETHTSTAQGGGCNRDKRMSTCKVMSTNNKVLIEQVHYIPRSISCINIL